MEGKKVAETRVLVRAARDLLLRHLHATPHSPLYTEEQAHLRATLQQLQPCLSILRSYERRHADLAVYELVMSAVGQVLGSLTGAADTSSVGAEEEDDGLLAVKAAQTEPPRHTTAPPAVPTPSAAVPSTLSAHSAPPTGAAVTWRSTYGCRDAILALRQATTLPLRHPLLFTGPRRPWRRLLLYGPPGTGKTRLAAATATEYGAAFLSVSAADLLSKWVGESEKQVRQAFAQAAAATPRCVLFFDEVDALCSTRGGHGESELARRLKTEFLLHLQQEVPTVTVLAATNLPWELDAAILRRFDHLVHVGLPSSAVKRRLLETELRGVAHDVSDEALSRVVERTERFSVVDVQRLLSHAVMAPVTEWLLQVETATHAASSRSGSRGSSSSRESKARSEAVGAATAPAPLLYRGPSPCTSPTARCRPSPPNADAEVLGDGAGSISADTASPQCCSPPRAVTPGLEDLDVEGRTSSEECSRGGGKAETVPRVGYRHFEAALRAVAATTSASDLARYAAWRCRGTAT
ncbi:ATPase-like protein [Novymonas esmeraldas]|uniref:ATPase-like protein n=1 Tax=Novymonas esmeraldas TaxID=1808958 RepID=A0AAW0EQ05_9TRYP